MLQQCSALMVLKAVMVKTIKCSCWTVHPPQVQEGDAPCSSAPPVVQMSAATQSIALAKPILFNDCFHITAWYLFTSQSMLEVVMKNDPTSAQRLPHT